MANDAHVDWEGVDGMIRRLDEYATTVRSAVRFVAEYWQPVIETFAKDFAPWADRSGNARQTLHAFVEDLSKDTVALYLAHGMDYGIWLEIANGGRYAIIWDTLSAHFDAISKMLKGIFGNGNVASSFI